MPLPRVPSDDFSSISDSELKAHIDRCNRLLEHDNLLKSLPDKGETIRLRLDLLVTECQKRKLGKVHSLPIGVEERKILHPHSSCSKKFNEGDVASIIQKYKDYRVNIEEKVREMYEGTLSEQEIQKMLEVLPPSFLLTWEETREMEKKMIKEQRKSELSKLCAESEGF